MLHWRLLLVTGLVATLGTVACSTSQQNTNADLTGTTDDIVPIEDGPEVDETGDELATAMFFATGDTAVCPPGSAFDEASGFCLAGDEAVGPFSAVMVAACKGSGTGCDAASWPLAQATSLRGDDTCMAGTSIDPDLGVCSDGVDVYGPFTQPMIDACTAAGGADACTTLRFSKRFVEALPDEDAIIAAAAAAEQGFDVELQSGCGTTLTSKMLGYYASRAGYDAVSRAGMKTLGTRHNGCATWLSHAIRLSGGSVTIQTGTEGFRDGLKAKGWKVITSKADLVPGDVIITKDRKGHPGHPDHVYMLAGWQGSLPLSVDNQGFTHVRTAGKSPINYGLRAPGATSCRAPSTTPAPTEDSCAGKSDGWYCSAVNTSSAYQCRNQGHVSGWQCSSSTYCRSSSSGTATLSGGNPGCFGSK